tara:strand:+ start:135 stop:494 length:360 start_codon:yes stop_codon:yes gene_type:complete
MARIEHRDVQLRYRDGGEEEVKNMIEEGASAYVFKQALKKVREHSEVEGYRLEKILKRHGVLSDNRGPARPRTGDRRVYSVQNVKGTCFVRIPVSILEVSAQELVEVEFRNDIITIKNV